MIKTTQFSMLPIASSTFFTDFNCFSLTMKKQTVYLASVTDYWCWSLFWIYWFSVAATKMWPNVTRLNILLNNTAGRPFIYLAKLIASSGSWTSSSSKCLSAMDCIFIRLCFVACCSVIMSGTDSSPCRRRDCTDSRNSVYKLFRSASELGNTLQKTSSELKELHSPTFRS